MPAKLLALTAANQMSVDCQGTAVLLLWGTPD